MNLRRDLTFSELNMRPRQSLVANPEACTGCRTCETVCSLVKVGRIQPESARLRVEREPFEGLFRPHVCRQCSTPHCLRACPEKAIGISPKTGAVIIDRSKCQGCGSCAEACPFGMIVFQAEEGQAAKCDLCGGQPNCLRVCPTSALGLVFFGPRSEG